MNDLSLVERLRYSGLGASWGALCKEAADEIERLQSELAALRAAQPEPVAGWKMVPTEPTEDMLFAAEMSQPRGYRALYEVMVAASPPPAQPAPAEPPEPAEPAEVYNPWRASLENCISGDNYLRASEYSDLIEELDELYRLRAAQPAQARHHRNPPSHCSCCRSN